MIGMVLVALRWDSRGGTHKERFCPEACERHRPNFVLMILGSWSCHWLRNCWSGIPNWQSWKLEFVDFRESKLYLDKNIRMAMQCNAMQWPTPSGREKHRSNTIQQLSSAVKICYNFYKKLFTISRHLSASRINSSRLEMPPNNGTKPSSKMDRQTSIGH